MAELARNGGRIKSEWVAELDRNRWPDNFGISGRIHSEYSNTEAANNLGVSESAIRAWRKKYTLDQNNNNLEHEAEIKRLRKENERLRMEREILKKAAAFFAKETHAISKESYGARRHASELTDHGIYCGRDRAKTLMKLAELRQSRKGNLRQQLIVTTT